MKKEVLPLATFDLFIWMQFSGVSIQQRAEEEVLQKKSCNNVVALFSCLQGGNTIEESFRDVPLHRVSCLSIQSQIVHEFSLVRMR